MLLKSMPLKIVYLDDEIDLCENFFDCFSSDEVEITTFTGPEMAIRAIHAHPPDLVFLDYRLPGTTGDEVAQKLALGIPVFLVTGDIRVSTKYEFTKIFSKPINEQEILSTIEKYKR